MIRYATLVILNLGWVGGVCGADYNRPLKMDRVGRTLPDPHSKEAIIAQLDIVYDRAQKKLADIKGLTFEQQRTELTTFHEENIKSIAVKINDLGFDIPYVHNIHDLLAQRLVEINFNIAVQSMYNSPTDFANTYKHYIRLPSDQVSAKQMQSLWKAALIHGDASQIQTLCSRAIFLSEHADGLCKRLNTCAPKEQLSCIRVLLQKSSTFCAVLATQEKKLGEGLWALAVRAAIVHGKGEKLLALFTDDTNKINDQLFMHTIAPFLSLKKVQYQKAYAFALSAWSQRLCANDHVSYHGRNQQVWELIQNTASFKKVIDLGDYGPYVRQWYGNFLVMVWKESIDKKSSHASSKNEQHALLKKAEALFAAISVSNASVLSGSDNKGRLSMHGAILSALLKDANTTEKMMLQWCENALKSGVDILGVAHIAPIARRISSVKLLNFIQPYVKNSPEMMCSLADLYQVGHQISIDGKLYWWLEKDLEKAKSLYREALNQGYEDALIPLASLMHNDYDGMYTTINNLCVKLPHSLFFKIQKASLLCTLLTLHDHPFNQQSLYLLDTIGSLNNSIRMQLQGLNTRDRVFYTALQASYNAVAYSIVKRGGTVFDTKQVMDALANYVHTAYAFAVKLQSQMNVKPLFDYNVYTLLRSYADTLLEKDPKELAYTDLNTMVVTGYMMLQLFDKNTLQEKDSQFLDRIITMCRRGDAHGKVPPLTHTLAYTALFKEGANEKCEQLFSHIVACLQDDVSKDELDIVARADGENTLRTMAFDGSVLSQMKLVMHNKNDPQEIIKKLAMCTKQIIAIAKEQKSQYIEQIYTCGAYAFLKESLLKSKCSDCAADMLVVLLRWIAGITHNGDKSDPLLRSFFDDLRLINSCRNG